MRFLSLLALGALALVSGSNVDSFPADVQAGFFAGRSGDVIIKPINNEPRDMMAMFVDNHNFLTSASAPSSLLDLADVALRTVGASPVHSEGAAASFVNANAFDRAAAHITLAVESLGQNSVSNELPHLQSLASAVSSPLSYNVYPADALSVSASLATGEVPASHGLVARTWSNSRGQTVRALSAEGVKNGARVANVADLVSQSFQGQSLTLSLSADDQLAAAHCVNPSLAKQHPEWNNFCLSFERSFGGLLSAVAPSASVDALVSALPSALRRVSEHSVAVRLNNGEEVILSMRVESEAALLRELALMVTLADKLNNNAKLGALVRDDTPDVYTLTISSLSGVMKQYGSDSAKVSAALKLVDACVPVILQRLSTLYNERVVSSVVLLGSASFPTLNADQQKALATKLNVKSLMNTFPNAYVPAVQRSASTCQLLNRRIESLGLQAYCAVAMPGYETMGLSASNNTNTTYPTDSEVRRYQIVLWFSILLALITIAAAFSIPCMDFKKDTLLYTSFNPTGSADDKRRH